MYLYNFWKSALTYGIKTCNRISEENCEVCETREESKTYK